MSDFEEYPYELDDLVQILDTSILGRIASVTTSKHHDARYLIEYADAVGNPKQGEWYHDQLKVIEPTTAADEAGFPDNVVQLRATQH